MIAKTTHHLFQHMLYQVATGIISSGEIAPPTRIILRKQKNAQVLLGEGYAHRLIPTRQSSRSCSATPTSPLTTA